MQYIDKSINWRFKKFLQDEIYKLKNIIETKDIKKNGPLITSTFSSEVLNGEQFVDIELLIPINSSEINLPSEYNFKKVFHLVNALHLRYEGIPTEKEITNCYNMIQNYIIEHNLQAVSNVYNVDNNDFEFKKNSLPIIDMYIGISLCKL